MTKRPPFAWENTPEFADKMLAEVKKHGHASAYVTPEQLAESNRVIEARRKAAAIERRVKKKGENR